VKRFYTSLHNISSAHLIPRNHFFAADSKTDQSKKKIRDSKKLGDSLQSVTKIRHLTILSANSAMVWF